jgi:hypothetical protein
VVPLAAAAAAVAAGTAVATLGRTGRHSEVSEREAITVEEDLFAAQVAEQQRQMLEVLGETADAKTPEEVAAILRRLEEVAKPGKRTWQEYQEEAAHPSDLSDHIQSGNSTGVDLVLGAATEVANQTNVTYSDKPSNLANCIINSIMAAITAGNAGLGIRHAVQVCPKTGRNDSAPGLCAGSIVQAVSSFIWMGSFLSGAVHTCMATPDLGADCAEDVMAVVGSLGTAVLAGAQMYYTCPPKSNQFSEQGFHNGFEPNKTDTFACVIDAIFGANTLANAIQGILNAVKDCSQDPIRPDGLSPSGLTIANKHLCAADAVGVASSFLWMANFVAQAVQSCAPTMNLDALCASSIFEMTASLTSMAGRSLRMADDCNPQILNDTRFNPSAAANRAPSGRINR